MALEKEGWGPGSVQWVVWEDVVDLIPTFHTYMYLEFQGVLYFVTGLLQQRNTHASVGTLKVKGSATRTFPKYKVYNNGGKQVDRFHFSYSQDLASYDVTNLSMPLLTSGRTLETPSPL